MILDIELPVLHGCGTFELNKGKNTLVDIDDWIVLSQWKWKAMRYANGAHYAYRQERDDSRKLMTITMHRVIMSPVPEGLLVDHENHDSLDNRRRNLRHATPSQNKSNSNKYKVRSDCASRFKGVSFHKHVKKWQAEIQKNHVKHQLGYFENEADAARAYDEAAKRIHGEFALTNEKYYGGF
jgi:hypothetical protein